MQAAIIAAETDKIFFMTFKFSIIARFPGNNMMVHSRRPINYTYNVFVLLMENLKKWYL